MRQHFALRRTVASPWDFAAHGNCEEMPAPGAIFETTCDVAACRRFDAAMPWRMLSRVDFMRRRGVASSGGPLLDYAPLHIVCRLAANIVCYSTWVTVLGRWLCVCVCVCVRVCVCVLGAQGMTNKGKSKIKKRRCQPHEITGPTPPSTSTPTRIPSASVDAVF